MGKKEEKTKQAEKERRAKVADLQKSAEAAALKAEEQLKKADPKNVSEEKDAKAPMKVLLRQVDISGIKVTSITSLQASGGVPGVTLPVAPVKVDDFSAKYGSASLDVIVEALLETILAKAMETLSAADVAPAADIVTGTSDTVTGSITQLTSTVASSEDVDASAPRAEENSSSDAAPAAEGGSWYSFGLW